MAELERNDSEALHNVATRRARLHNCVAKVRHSLSKTFNAVVDFDEDVAALETEHTEEAGASETLELCRETGVTKNQ